LISHQQILCQEMS